MVSVASLLNPLPSPLTLEPGFTVPDPRKVSSMPGSSTASPRLTASKMPTSAPLVAKTHPTGEINYKPCEVQDETIAAEHKKFQMEPLSRIGERPRRIPYSSDKKSFQQKTGRDAIEAYVYSFRMPDDVQDDEHTIMWDYNIGLVRITALFKSLKHSKTMPAKVMSANKGLREISHSITGGSITAQGYWVPFEAAKAVAATFCWDIRYALTPVFGTDFPNSCIKPDQATFMSLKIDPAIVKHCEDLAKIFRTQSSNPKSSHTSAPSKSGAPWALKPLRPKKTADVESGYGTDSDRSPLGSPVSTGSELWVAVNVSRPIDWRQCQLSVPEDSRYTTPAPKSTLSSVVKNEKKSPKKREAVDHERPSDASTIKTSVTPKRQKHSAKENTKKLTQEALAAKTLMELHRADVGLDERVRAMSRRATV